MPEIRIKVSKKDYDAIYELLAETIEEKGYRRQPKFVGQRAIWLVEKA